MHNAETTAGGGNAYSLDANLSDVEERGRDGWNVNKQRAASGRVYYELI